MASSDPYETLGVSPASTDAELRAAYRRAVQRHHPDHNGGTAESARRFEAIQEAYARIHAVRGSGLGAAKAAPSADPGLDSRLADIEGELAAAREAKERARRTAQAAASAATAQQDTPRASDDELGYVTTEDSFGKIFTDAAADLLDELGGRLKGEPPKR